MYRDTYPLSHIYIYPYFLSEKNPLTFFDPVKHLRSVPFRLRANAATSFLSERATVARARLMGGSMAGN